MMAIQLDNHLLGQIAERRRRPNAGGQHNASAGREVGRFNYRYIHGTEEAVPRHLRHQRQMQVEEAGLPGVDAIAQIGISLVWRAKTHRSRFGECAIERWAGGSAGQDANLEFLAGTMGGVSAFRDRQRDCLRRAGRSESAESHVLPVLDERRSFRCG